MKRFVIAALLIAGSFSVAKTAAAKPLTETTGSSTFPAEDLQRGSTATESLCASIPLAVWVTVDGKGDCVRFYASGLRPNANAEVLVYFHGDQLAELRILSGYQKESPDSIQHDLERWAQEAGGRPVVFMGRAGAYGSSGDHSQRRRPREGKLTTAALQTFKVRHGIGTFHLAGQSGGGELVATMLNMRSDIGCAVIASGSVSVWRRAQAKGQLKDTTGYNDSYDPVDHVMDIQKSPSLRIMVLSSRHDQTVPFETQEYYVNQLKRVGLTPVHIELPGTGASFHGLSEFAKPAVAWCAQGLPDSEIKRRLESQAK